MLKIKRKLNRQVTKKLASLLEINLINRYESFTKINYFKSSTIFIAP